MTKIVLVGFPEATITNDIFNLICNDNLNVTILHPDKFLNDEFEKTDKFAVTVTRDILLRKQIINKLDQDNLQRATFVHKSCVVDPGSTIGDGTIMSQFSSVLYQSTIDKDCLIAPYCMIAHKSVVGQGTMLMPGSMIAGSTTVGKFCILGLRSSIIDNINICDDVQLGAGALITKNISLPGHYVGAPARKVS